MSFSGEQYLEGPRLSSSNLKRRGLHTICTALSEKLNGERSTSIMELDPATLNLGSVEGRVITSVSHGTTNAPVVLAAALSNIAEHSYAAKPTAGTSSNGSKVAGKASANGEDPSSSSSSDSSSSDSETEEVATKEVASGPAKAIVTVAPPVTLGKSPPRQRSQPVKYADEMQKFQSGGSSKGTNTPNAAKQKATPKAGGSTTRGRPAKSARQTTVDEEKKKPEPEQKRRGRGCGQCEGCLREDCGTCTFCRDKPKFGGPGTKKQKCALRVCSNFVKKVCVIEFRVVWYDKRDGEFSS